MIGSFRDSLDIHQATAAGILGIPLEEVTSEQRSQAKAINYGIIYGMGPRRLSKSAGLSLAQAKEFIERYFQGFPKIRDFTEEAVAFAEEHGFCRTVTGRKRPIEGFRQGGLALVNAREYRSQLPPGQCR